MTTTTSARTPSRRTVAGYALGSVGTGGFGTLPGLVLDYYLTDTLGVAAGLASLAVTVPKIWDVVIDPLVGVLSDRSAARRGSRRPFLLAGALALPPTFAAVFAVPAALAGGPAAAWVVVAFVVAATAFSLFQVPYIALPAELASGYDQRTRLLNHDHANISIDIHADGGPSSGRGFAILLPVADGPNDRVIKASVRFGGYLRSRMIGMAGMPVSTYDGTNGLAYRNDLAGLNLTTQPKVLIECGNMRNATDAKLLTSKTWQLKAASAMLSAINKMLVG